MKCQESLESRKLKNEYQLRTNSGKSGRSRPKQTKNRLIVTILLRQAGEEMPPSGPPPQIPFLDAWITASVQNLLLFLPFLCLILVALRLSGKWERRVIAEQLANEVGGAVTPEEYAAIQRDGIFRTRRIKSVDRRRSAALVNAQHELAFRKRSVIADGDDPETDKLVAGWRREIAALRARFSRRSIVVAHKPPAVPNLIPRTFRPSVLQ